MSVAVWIGPLGVEHFPFLLPLTFILLIYVKWGFGSVFFILFIIIIKKKLLEILLFLLYFSLFKAKPVNDNTIHDHADNIKRGSCMNIYEI